MKKLFFIVLFVGCAHQKHAHFVVVTGYSAHETHYGQSSQCTPSSGISSPGMSWVCGYGSATGHQWQSRTTGVVCGTTTPENDGEWGFNQLGTDLPHIEFDTEKAAFDFGSQWCKP
jgi:hypothetical protein